MTRALEFTREAESFPDVDSFRRGILPGLRELVSCDVAGYNEVDVEEGTILVLESPLGTLPPELYPRLIELADEHPVLVLNRSGDLRPYAISDFLSARRFHGLALYGDLYAQIDAEDQLAFGLPGGVTIGIALNRSRRGFSRRDRDLLDLIRPHLSQARRHVQARERKRDLVAALEQGLELMGGAIVMIDRSGRIEDASDFARQLLSAYVGRDGALQAGLDDWIAGDPGASTLAIAGRRGRLIVRRLERGDGAPGSALLLTEFRSGQPALKELRDLGLTRREAEVLLLVATGMANRAIASELGVAVGTVRKHLERIYARLGVHSRTEAATVALKAGDLE